MKYYLLLIPFLLIGCKAKQIDWSSECAQRFPPTTKYIQGETITEVDTIFEQGLIIQADPILVRGKCPPNKTITITKKRTDTIEVESIGSKAKIKALENELQVNGITVSKEKEKSAEAIKQAKERTNQRNNLFIIASVLLVWSCRKYLIKIISPLA